MNDRTPPTSGGVSPDGRTIDLTELEVLALVADPAASDAAGAPAASATRSLALLDNRTRDADPQLRDMLRQHGLVSLLTRRLALDTAEGPRPHDTAEAIGRVLAAATRWVRLVAWFGGDPALYLVVEAPEGVVVATQHHYGIWSYTLAQPGATAVETAESFVAGVVVDGESPTAVLDLFEAGTADDPAVVPRLLVARDADHEGRFALALGFEDDDLQGPDVELVSGRADDAVREAVRTFVTRAGDADLGSA